MPVTLFAYTLGFLIGVGIATPSAKLAIFCMIAGSTMVLWSFLDSRLCKPFLRP